MSRREFINKTSLITGASYSAMYALGLLQSSPAKSISFSKHGNEKGKKVIILGAGLAGLSSAYELNKLGYEVQILEARARSGGRVWTVRKGTSETEIDGKLQTCTFDEGQYLNAGAGRIPHHHEISLKYCKELGIAMEVFTNVNEAAFYYSEGKGPLANKSIPIRQVHADFRGYTCELLAKAIDQKALDLPMSQEDVDKLLEYLKAEGDLNIDKIYQGSERRGYKKIASAGLNPPQFADPFLLREIIYSGFTHPAFQNVGEYTYNQQPIMLQPIGGMEQIPKAFEKILANKIIFQAEVTGIKKNENGVKISYKDKNGLMTESSADYCICTIPFPVLKNIPSDFSDAYKKAINDIPYMNTGKIGLQFKRRFWEEDDHIFGGITKTNMNITQIFYPSTGFLGQKGVLKGYYNFHNLALEMGNLSIEDRLKRALYEGGKIHPQYATEFETGFSLAWQKIKYSQGGWAAYTNESRQLHFSTLQKPDGPIYFAGEHTTYLTAWMAGAFVAAQHAVESIHSRVSKK
ncbi:MAG: flavin monoamine oxidase family protein [Cytophagales bacterium]|nr:MAG: flavin monoamine oxidase family protein [Cytophagales bacterium]